MSQKKELEELKPSDFADSLNFPMRMMRKVTETPSKLRLAGLSAWRGKERGLAVLAGVFLASLVITTVLSYGVGLSQLFFEESLKGEPFDGKIEFARTPTENSDGWSNNTTTLTNVCDELMTEFSKEFTDCTLVLGRQGIHSGGFFNAEFIVAQPLEMNSVVDDSNPYWSNVTFAYPELAEGGPPISNMRSVRFLGPEAFDGEFADRLSENIIAGMGEWPTPENMSAQRGVILPSTIASQAKASVGDVLESFTFHYVVDESTLLEASVTNENCDGVVTPETNEMIYCRMPMTVTNVTIVGVYEPWDLGNPTLAPNPIFTTWEILEESQRAILIDNDHMYLGVTIDRGELPTSSTADAAEWLEELGSKVQSGNYTDDGIKLYYTDIVGGTIVFLNIFLGLIQIFDYIIMIPIVILSISVLIYGLVLSLEQRRREVSIHRVIGADSTSLQSMVLLELFVMSSVAWFAGYLLALFAVPIVLSSVGFMEFRMGDFDVNPTLTIASTILTAVTTLGLALLFGRSKARDFISLEIEEGVRKTTTKSKPKTWLHWLAFSFGMLAVIDTWLEMNGSEDGIVSNFFVEGLIGIFGPFALWIGGALLLGRIGAKGPQIMQVIFGRTSLLKDVKRGLKGSGSTESVNRLAVIMLLTLSIVTLAAVQGYTGTLVDEKTVDASVGSDLQITLEQNYNEGQLLSLLSGYIGDDVTPVATTNPSIFLAASDGGDKLQVWVVLDDNEDVLHWSEQSLPGENVAASMAAYRNGGFSAGQDAAYSLDIAGSNRGGDENKLDDILLKPSDKKSENISFTWEELTLNFSTGGTDQPDPMALWNAYSNLMEGDWSGLNLSGQDLSGRDFGPVDLSGTDLSNSNLVGANLSQALMVNTNLEGADLSGADLTDTIIVNFGGGSIQGANLIGADLTGLFGIVDLNSSILGNATCPDGTSAEETSCASGVSQIPPSLAAPLFFEDTVVQIIIIPHMENMYYMGVHEYIPGVNPATMSNSLIIGESSWQSFVGAEAVDNYNSTTWIVKVDGVSGDSLEALASTLSADSRVASVVDWSSAHKDIERNGGLIFGTPGLLSLQFVVASLAAVASSFVFLSLVLSQRQKELAVLQAIGASPNQIIRLVLFEILSIVMVSMALGIVLGIGVALSFNGFFDVFGFIFQIFGGSSTTIQRTLVYPWYQLLLVSLSVFAAVVVSLLVTTRKALKSDLASVLKGE
jgi:uncharacterized protein YjbI with pentapeptide repeats